MGNFSYALYMLTVLDSVYLFEDIDHDIRRQIEEMFLENLCEEVVLFNDINGKPVCTRGCEFQNWYQMDYKEGQGFVYQLQYLLHEISRVKADDELRRATDDLMLKIQNAKVAFTVYGLKSCLTGLEEILNSLKKLYNNKETVWVSSEMKNRIYDGDIPEEVMNLVTECGSGSSLSEKGDRPPGYIRDFAEIVKHCLRDENYLLLFVRDEDDVRRYLSVLNKDYDVFQN